MILVDTSVWIHHFRKKDQKLIDHLNIGSVACHPYVIGELACGNLGNRAEILMLLKALPSTPILEPSEMLYFIEKNLLMGRGLGYVDIHLLASAILGNVVLWTADRRLREAATELEHSYLNG
ncbi:MAG: type II toxin-antitoxin system VapC family toxin [Desulfatitalea sp.]|nr:type II toxin-antitoxin system VapC family toxin [Desulfatitalea sp.]NNK02215.1 type II toxin-antitoxin system VapC family toxin [Desulfatitalea sp.]